MCGRFPEPTVRSSLQSEKIGFVFRRKGRYADPVDAPRHVDRLVRKNLDFDRTARHVHRHAIVDKTESVCRPGRRTAARAGGQRVAGASLVDFDLDVLAVQHFEELHVDAVGKVFGILHQRPQFAGVLLIDLVHGNDAVRVTDGNAGGPIDVPAELHRLVDDDTVCSGYRNF